MGTFFDECSSVTKLSLVNLFSGKRYKYFSKKMSSQMIQSSKRVSAKDKRVQNCEGRCFIFKIIPKYQIKRSTDICNFNFVFY